VITNTKFEEKWFNNNKLRWCALFSACCYSDRHARPSVCSIQLVCRIPLCRSADRHAHPSACLVRSVCRISLCRFSDRHACPYACPFRSVCRISLRRSSDRHAHPSACRIRLVCRISLCPSSDRHPRPSAYPIKLVCCFLLHQSSDRHACPSACPIRSDCRISLRRSSDWHLRHSRVLAADLHLFSFSRDVDTAFAAALLAPALVITMIQTYKTPLLQRSVAEEDRMPKRFFNDDMVWIILRCKTHTWKFMGRGRLPGKRIVACSASKVTTCSSVYQSCLVVVNSMLHQQGDTTLIIYQSCHAIVKQDDNHYTWLTLLRFYLRIWLSPSWIWPIAANVFLLQTEKMSNFWKDGDDSHFLIYILSL